MEWGDNEHRVVVGDLHKCKMERGNIFRTLLPLGITRNIVYRTMRLFEVVLGGVIDRPRSGRPRTVRNPQMIKGDQRSVIPPETDAETMNFVTRNECIAKIHFRIIKKDLGLSTYTRQTNDLLRTALMVKREAK